MFKLMGKKIFTNLCLLMLKLMDKKIFNITLRNFLQHDLISPMFINQEMVITFYFSMKYMLLCSLGVIGPVKQIFEPKLVIFSSSIRLNMCFWCPKVPSH